MERSSYHQATEILHQIIGVQNHLDLFDEYVGIDNGNAFSFVVRCKGYPDLELLYVSESGVVDDYRFWLKSEIARLEAEFKAI